MRGVVVCGQKPPPPSARASPSEWLLLPARDAGVVHCKPDVGADVRIQAQEVVRGRSDGLTVPDDQHGFASMLGKQAVQSGGASLQVGVPGFRPGRDRLIGMLSGDAAEGSHDITPALPIGAAVVGFAKILDRMHRQAETSCDDVGSFPSTPQRGGVGGGDGRLSVFGVQPLGQPPSLVAAVVGEAAAVTGSADDPVDIAVGLAVAGQDEPGGGHAHRR